MQKGLESDRVGINKVTGRKLEEFFTTDKRRGNGFLVLDFNPALSLCLASREFTYYLGGVRVTTIACMLSAFI